MLQQRCLDLDVQLLGHFLAHAMQRATAARQILRSSGRWYSMRVRGRLAGKGLRLRLAGTGASAGGSPVQAARRPHRYSRRRQPRLPLLDFIEDPVPQLLAAWGQSACSAPGGTALRSAGCARSMPTLASQGRGYSPERVPAAGKCFLQSPKAVCDLR